MAEASPRQDLLTFMRRPVAEAAPDAFEALALRVFAWQFAHNEPYAAFCRRRGRTPDRVAHWTGIPAVPTQAFKALPLITAGVAAAAGAAGAGVSSGESLLFRTSGTTRGRERRGEHHVSDPALYHASLLPTFAAYLLPDGARLPMCSLVPPAADVPDSSLAHMVDRVMAEFGAPGGGGYVDGAGRLDAAGLDARLGEHVAAGTPVCLLGTSLALLRWLEELDDAGRSLALPAGSRLMDTGGYKGSEREVSEGALRRLYERVLGLPADHCVNEYGMTELLSQYYDDVLRRRVVGGPAGHVTGAAGAAPAGSAAGVGGAAGAAPEGPRPKAGPPWLRALAADPDTLEPLPPGEEGILRHVDLANLGSVAAVQTEDVGVVLADGRVLLKGRLAGAEPRGCSRAMDQLLEAAGERVSVFEAWHLPGLEADHVEEWRERVLPDGVRLRWPWLRAGAMRRLAGRVAAARDALDRVPVAEIIAAVDRVAGRLLDPADPLRAEAEALLPAVTGFHPAMVALVLDRMAAEWRAPALERLLEAELGGAAAVDGFVELPGGRRARAFPPRLALHVFAGNVPGVAVTSLIRVLLVRGASVGKTAAGEPVLPVLFARALAAEHAVLGEALAVTYWPGGEGPAEREALAAADVVVAYGGAAAMAALRRAAPPDARLVEHGPRVSVGIVGPGALASADRAATVAREAARAIAVVDQQGCVSPQALLIVDGCPVTPLAFTRALAAAFEALEAALPRGRLEPGESAAVHRLRNEAEFRAIAGDPVEIFAPQGTAWTVVLDATGELRASCLNRFVTVHPVPSLDAAVARLAPLGGALQTVAVAGVEDPAAAAAALGRLGATRVSTFSSAPWPPGHGLHDGRGPLRELVRWTELEGGA